MTGAGQKVFAAMSGGVDSSVAALLLIRAGYAVTGVTFKLFANEDVGEDADRPCCSLESINRARAVCSLLGIPHYTMNFTREFNDLVIDRFAAEYAAGCTPNPCVSCNRHIKFDVFLRRARAIGAKYIATGHHARIEKSAEGLFHLLPGADPDKDQSYALCHLNQSTMPHVLLPDGRLCKDEVRTLAREMTLPTAETSESQDICFVRQGGYAEFLASRGLQMQPGPIVEVSGRLLGEHRGLQHYTVGQRRHLGISSAGRLYVVEKRLADNTLVVGGVEDVLHRRVRMEDVNWCDLAAGQWPPNPQELPVAVMLRYRQTPVPCTIAESDADGRRVHLELTAPAIAAPGQLAVLYDTRDGHVVGGGTIR